MLNLKDKVDVERKAVYSLSDDQRGRLRECSTIELHALSERMTLQEQYANRLYHQSQRDRHAVDDELMGRTE